MEVKRKTTEGGTMKLLNFALNCIFLTLSVVVALNSVSMTTPEKALMFTLAATLARLSIQEVNE